MYVSGVIDVVIGMVFIYLLTSMLCSHVSEWIAYQIFKLRSKTLAAGIRNMLNDPHGTEFVDQFFQHPLITGLVEPSPRQSDAALAANKASKPSYIPSRTFALTLLDIIAPADPATGPKSFAEVRGIIATLPNDDTRKALLALMDASENDLGKARKHIEDWFDGAMDRASGWYKREAKRILLVISIVVTLFLNIDSIQIASSLWRNPKLREATLRMTEDFLGDPRNNPQSAAAVDNTTSPPAEDATKGGGAAGTAENPAPGEATPPHPSVEKMNRTLGHLHQLEVLTLPLGWPAHPFDAKDHRALTLQRAPLKFVGWIITIMFVSLGAPFWFAVVNQFINIRRTGQPPEKK